ncbi:MAG TPA: bifunctional DNA-formamidopyrimidine glycosylase/DNA-(apurinic or apyrimidinic site) lyase [Candidatus Woesebacteria bacterium]|nr:bifunctional DNA-formamidopyrimidine glycosylase/DNA-(apurinic or apyrimidinic site) lyase [Candidatus Woesebacteria bacterium]
MTNFRTMPELPEVESIRLYLQDHLVGKTLQRVEIFEQNMFVGEKKHIIHKKVTDILRSGKILTLKFQNDMYASFHLKLSGQILYAPNKDKTIFNNPIPRTNTNKMPGRTTRIILHFSDNSALYFNDMRKFGWMKVGEKPQMVKGIDVLSEKFTFEYFEKVIAKTSRPIKIILMDQDKIGGVGNIYANDALYSAKIHPARKANSLNQDELKNLYREILHAIKEGLYYKGSSAKDELYVLPDGEKGNYQNHFKAYHMHGTPCKNCGTIMERIEVGGRGTFICPKCQQL